MLRGLGGNTAGPPPILQASTQKIIPQLLTRRLPRLQIPAVDDSEPKSARRHGMRLGRAIFVERDLHARHLRHASHLLDQSAGWMTIAAVRPEQHDGKSVA